MKKCTTTLNKQDLRDYLNWIDFVEKSEIEMAVNDFFVENFEIINPSYGDLWYYSELADQYLLENAIAFS